MQPEIPIGERESQVLEFKSAAALRNMPSIAREVVAFLNAGRGQLWIGLTEHDGIATSIDPVKDAAERKLDLLNHLIDVIRPTPSAEVTIRVVDDGEGQELIVIDAQPRPNTLYYFRKDGGRFWVKRVDHRIRAMTEEETDKSPVNDQAPIRLREHRDSVLRERQAVFWIGVQPSPLQNLNIQAGELNQLLLDPTRSGNRVGGWNFRFPFHQTELASGRLRLGDPKLRLTTIAKDGGIEFRQVLERLKWNDRDRQEIYPLALAEYVTSLIRLADKVCGLPMSRSVERILVDLVMTGIEGWTLPAYDRDTHGYRLSMEGPPLAQVARPGRSRHPELTLDRPFEFAVAELHANPDALAFRVLREVFEQFGLREESIPRQFDRSRQRLVLPD